VKVAVVAPAATVTVAGTVAAAVLLLASVTRLCAAVPAAGASSVTVPVEFATPPRMLVGFRVTETTESGLTIRVAVVDPFNVAVMTGLAAAVTT
jgi:hypothetical protein